MFKLREEIQTAVDYSGGGHGSGSNAVTLSLREALHTCPAEPITSIHPPPAAVYGKLAFFVVLAMDSKTVHQARSVLFVSKCFYSRDKLPWNAFNWSDVEQQARVCNELRHELRFDNT